MMRSPSTLLLVLLVAVVARADEGETEELKPLPFGLISTDNIGEYMKRAQEGIVWVCFPSDKINVEVAKYGEVFDEIGNSAEWKKYPFVYLDTNTLGMYDEHSCVEGVTTVVFQKGTKVLEYVDGVRGERDVSTYRKTFQDDEPITLDGLKSFMQGVEDGKIPKYDPEDEEL